MWDDNYLSQLSDRNGINELQPQNLWNANDEKLWKSLKRYKAKTRTHLNEG